MTTFNIQINRYKCANCGFVFESYMKICPKCDSNAVDLVKIAKAIESQEIKP